MFERRRQEVQQSLEHLVGSDKALEELTDRLREAPGRIPRGQIKTLLQEVLKELSDDVLRWLWWLNQCMSEDCKNAGYNAESCRKGKWLHL